MKTTWMKKNLVTAVALGCIAGVPCVGMAAAAGGFDDVPHDNWSYGAVQTLLKDGVIDNFDDNTFNGQKIVTRFEMAQIIRRATNKAVNSPTITANDKTLLVKLSQEYKKELSQLKSGSLSQSSNEGSGSGSAVKAGRNGVVDFSDTKAYIRYDYWSNKNAKNGRDTTCGKDNFFMDIELRGRYEFAPKWNLKFMHEMARTFDGYNMLDNSTSGTSGDAGELREYSVEGPVNLGKIKGKLSIGRYKYKPNFGYITKAYMQGAIYNFQATKKLNVELAWGKLSNKYYRTDATSKVGDDFSNSALYGPYSQEMGVLALRYQATPKDRIYGGYYFLGSKQKTFKDVHIGELGGQHDFDKKFTGYYDFARSNRGQDNAFYYVGIKYNKDDMNKPKSWSWLFQYAFSGAMSTIKSDLDICNYGALSPAASDVTKWTGDADGYYQDYKNSKGAYNGAKGICLTYKYVPVRNTNLVLRWLYFKPIHITQGSKNAFEYRSQLRAEWDIYFK